MTESSNSNQPIAKKSTTETGNAINLANFLLLIQSVAKLRENYNPSDADLEIESLEEQYKEAKASLANCTSAETNFDNETDSRSMLFKQMKRIGNKVHRSFKASKAPKTAKDGAQTIMNKLNGKVSKPKKKEILAEGEEAQKSISTSQLSYTQLTEHFKKLRELVISHPTYNPNEEDLKTIALADLETKLNDSNANVGDAITSWRRVRQIRSRHFYAPETGFVDTALRVKNYVASVYETTSAEFKEINKIKFRNIKD